MDTTEEGKAATEPFPNLILNVRKMTNNAVSELNKIFIEHGNIAKHLEAYDMNIKNREKELEEEKKKAAEKALRLAEERKIENDELHSRIVELHSRNTAELQKELDNALRLAGEREMEKEKLHRTVAELQKKLDCKAALELAHKVNREFDEDGQVRLKNKMDGEVPLKNMTNATHRDSEQKDKHIERVESLKSTLTAKLVKSNDSLEIVDQSK